MSSWHNKYGQHGQRLTILSVLPRAPLHQIGLALDSELSLGQAIDELFRIAGDDGHAWVLFDVCADRSAGSQDPPPQPARHPPPAP